MTRSRLRLLLAAHLLSAIGTGLVAPMTPLFLHEIRGMGAGMTAAVLLAGAVTGTASAAASGRAVDRLGIKAVAVAGCLLQTAGFVALCVVPTSTAIVVAAIVVGLGYGMLSTARVPLIAQVAPAHRRQWVFSVRYLFTNVGIGVGALVGGLVAALGTLAAYQSLFFVNAATYAVFAAVVVGVSPARTTAAAPRAAGARKRTPALLRDRRLRTLALVQAGATLFGLSQFDSGLPLILRAREGLSPGFIGALIATNTVAVVVLQIPITRATAKIRPGTSLAIASVVWCSAWLAGLSGHFGGGPWLEVVLPLVFVMIALGECLLTPVMGPLVIDLAPRDLIGRYSGTVAATTSAAMLVGAPLGAWVALAAPPTAYWLVLAAGAAALAVVVRTASWESPILTRHSPRLLGTGTAPFHG